MSTHFLKSYWKRSLLNHKDRSVLQQNIFITNTKIDIPTFFLVIIPVLHFLFYFLCYLFVDENHRVRIIRGTGVENEDDYINASFLGIANEYIASQAPTPAAFEDFWLMVLQEEVSVIVMLTKEKEGNKVIISFQKKKKKKVLLIPFSFIDILF